MKNFRITVNGNTYDVSVEELGSSASSAPAAHTSAVSAPVPSAVPKTPASAPAVSGSEGNIKVTAPMPGTILDIKVSVGDKVKENSVVVVLEAMKMENEIVTPSAGTVASVNVTKGASVNSGDVLITITE